MGKSEKTALWAMIKSGRHEVVRRRRIGIPPSEEQKDWQREGYDVEGFSTPEWRVPGLLGGGTPFPSGAI